MQIGPIGRAFVQIKLQSAARSSGVEILDPIVDRDLLDDVFAGIVVDMDLGRCRRRNATWRMRSHPSLSERLAARSVLRRLPNISQTFWKVGRR